MDTTQPKPPIDYVREAVGRVWTAEDAEYVEAMIRKSDQLAQETFDRITQRTQRAA